MPSAKPVVILDPAPQSRDRIFDPATIERLRRDFDVIDLEAQPDEGLFERHLPDAFAIVGQPNLGTEALERAQKLRAVINVEGNFFANIDYTTAHQRGVRVLGCGPAYAQAVAEYALGLALDLARGISREDRRARRGVERYVSASTQDSVLLRRSNIALVGYGNLGRSLHRLLMPFHATIRVHDPWLPTSVLEEEGLIPATLEEALRTSTFVFVLATATSESRHLLDAQRLAILPQAARLILLSRAAVVDYDALYNQLAEGRILAAIDVWPEEPLAADSPFRKLDNAILSAHRAGGIPEAFLSIGEMVYDDLRLMARGLPPQRMQVAAPELVGRYRNQPVT